MNPRDPQAAQTIVAEYAALLQEHSEKEIYPSLVTSLPYPKEDIKTAIRTSVEALTRSGQLTAELRDFLEISYVSLADFVDEELARLLWEYRAAAAALEEPGRLAKDRVASPAWQTLASSGRLAGDIAGAIARETEDLRSEFNRLL
jgi:hypothetical protein